MKPCVSLIRLSRQYTRTLKLITHDLKIIKPTDQLLASCFDESPQALQQFVIKELSHDFERHGLSTFEGSDFDLQTAFLQACLDYKFDKRPRLQEESEYLKYTARFEKMLRPFKPIKPIKI